MAEERVCVYAVVAGATGPLRTAGVAGERLQRARVAGVDLVIGRMARLPRPTTAALQRYDATVRGLMATHGSVLPARYGTCSSTLDDLARSVRDRRDSLRRALRLVRQRVQMTVRVFASEPARAASASAGAARPRTRPGTEYLRKRAAEMQVPGAEPLRAAVDRWIRAERVERVDRGRLAGTVYHLIPRNAATAYRRALERAAVEAGLTTVVSGPWPPYAFGDPTF